MLGFAVLPVDFEFGDGDRLGQLDQPGHALAKCGECTGAAVEKKRVGFGRGSLLRSRIGAWIEFLRAEDREQFAYALAPAFGKLDLRQGLGEQLRHGVEIEGVAEAAAHGFFQMFRTAAGFGALEIRLENIRKLEHQPVQILAERLGLLFLHRAPGVLQQARGQGCIAIGQYTVNF